MEYTPWFVIILLAKTFTNLGSSTVEAFRSFVRDVECDDLTTSQKYAKLHRLFIQYLNSRRKIFLRGAISEVALGAVAISLPLDSRFSRSNWAEGDGFLG
jgi:hypothetical protein